MAEEPQQRIRFERSPKRVRAMFNAKTIVDTLSAGLVFEKHHKPVYYFPREDLRMDCLERSSHQTHCPYKGDASYWHLIVGSRRADNAVWSYEAPLSEAEPFQKFCAFYWDKVDHWFEEDEEVFGHPRDPYHRIDVRQSSRTVRVLFGGHTIAFSRRALMLFETGLPTRYYLPRLDVDQKYLELADQRTTCPYKGEARYFSLVAGGKQVENAVWTYPEPLPECPRIRDHLCFYPDKVDALEVEGLA